MPYFIQSKILETFLQVLNMSLTASIIIVFVLVARLLLKKAPKIFSYAMWSVVFFRLLCPISFESMFSLLPINASPISTNTIYSETPQISTGITAVDNAINPILPAPANGASVNPLQIAATIGEILWLLGIVVLLTYSIISLLRLRKNLIGAVKVHDNIFLADHIASPFVIGLFRPKIYLPSTLSEHEQSYIILHEQTHIRRFDHVMKIVAFAALCIHWFNPLVWIAFTLTIKDMEMSCDESVMKRLGANIREEYSASLLSLASGRKIIAGTPLAFGEGDTKSRIKNLIYYKKPALWVMLAALVAVATIFIAFASNPQRTSMEWAKTLRVEDVEKIELVVMPSSENERYRLFDRSEFSDVVALVNKSRGGYLPIPESLAGGSIMYYITTTDGVRHEFGNNGNTYLMIDGDSYDAGYNWLSSWGNVKGNAPLPETFLFGNENFLTLDELKLIAQKGDAISWDDFAPYDGRDVGSGLYIMHYPMEQPYYVRVGGVPGEPPMYIRLCSTETEQYIDIRQESIDEFIQKSETRVFSDLRPMLMIDGELYLDTGTESPMGAAVAVDGTIQTTVTQSAKPAENEQSNFGYVGSSYVIGDDFVVVNIDEKWFVFEKENEDSTSTTQ
ncbi:Signal transducer regulating beta-lactamase production, contains metallopeptidase domain [Anaerovirgula multivorans]|uniref:Signal transducer regulating beta-lactamase production, contains metallopeptidase domain n=1 Tax=Anaerovirgula multivorans TaxID=312168 RepID=A0A239EST1_9FIRM|nr:M56 family metallopeptidase [Anaerovirgula multivorans]SNS47639.1 Signal transducer regulating beta-lactamase production, contains metallopeptidase domain [Anaerovirgula multivorans]